MEIAKTLASANLPRKRNWANLLAHYWHTRKLAYQLSDDDEMFACALEINDEAYDALIRSPAPSLADVAAKLEIMIKFVGLVEEFDPVLADLKRLSM